MAFTAGSIADGQVTDALANLYAVPASTKAYCKSLSIANTNSVTQTVKVYIKRSGGTARLYRQFILLENESADVITPGTSIQLSTGDAIQAISTTTAVVDWALTGVLET